MNLFWASPGRHRSHDFGGDVIKIDGLRNIERNGVEPGNAQKLTHKPAAGMAL